MRCGTTGITSTLSTSLGSELILVEADEGLMTMAVGGLLCAMAALVSDTPAPALHLMVATRGAEALMQLSSVAISGSPRLLAHFFDEECVDRPGGFGSAVALAATRRVMELHSGHVSAEPIGPAGCRVTLKIPT